MKVKIIVNNEVIYRLPIYSQGQSGQKVQFKILDNNENVINLNGYNITLKLRILSDYNEYLLKNLCTIDNASLGLCSYIFQEGDLFLSGSFEATLDVDNRVINDEIKLGYLDVSEVKDYSTPGTIISSAGSTDDLPEGGGNLYFTDERVDDRVNNLIIDTNTVSWVYNDVDNTLEANAQLNNLSTDNLPEGSNNLYYKDYRVKDDMNVALQDTTQVTWNYANNEFTAFISLNDFSTSDLSEGINLYYTQDRFDTAFSNKSTTDLSEGNNLYFTSERVDDRVNELLIDNSQVVWSYNDSLNTLQANISLNDFSTDDLTEGSNRYYTEDYFRISLGNFVSDSQSINWTYNSEFDVYLGEVDYTLVNTVFDSTGTQDALYVTSDTIIIDFPVSSNNNIELNGNIITGGGEPISGTDLTNKDYVDSKVQGLSWNNPVISEIDFTTNEPASPIINDRYINTVTGDSSETLQTVTANNIYTWNGTTWTEYVVAEGDAVWIDDLDVSKVFDGSAWVKFGSTVTHNNTSGLQGGVPGEYYHFSQTDYTDLTDSGDSSLHYHSSDRNRTNHTGTQLSSTISDFNEAVDEEVNSLLIDGANITKVYDDSLNTLTLSVPNDLTVIGNYSTSDLSEGTNLYFTEERVDDRVNNLLIGGNNISLTYDDVGNSLTIDGTDTQLSEEQVQDYAWNVLTGDQTLITVTYDDVNNNVDFIVNSDLSLYDNSVSGFTTYSSSDFDVDWNNKKLEDLSDVSGSLAIDNILLRGEQGEGWIETHIDTAVNTVPSVTANTTHRTSDGSDHTFIDQDVTSGSSPTFGGVNITTELSNDTTPELGGDLDCLDNNLNNMGYGGFNVVDNGNSGTGIIIDWTTGAFQKLTLTDNTTLTFTDPFTGTTNVTRMELKVVQDATGGRDVTMPSNLVWIGDAPVFTDGTAGQKMRITILYDDGDDEYVAQATGWY